MLPDRTGATMGGIAIDPATLESRYWDHVIVGAGSAGCVLARRLSEDPDRRVLLIEAGEPPSDPAIWAPHAWPSLTGGANDWNYFTVPQLGLHGRRIAQPRGKGMGGSTLINALAFQRGPLEAYDSWAQETGDPGWGAEALLPCFRRLETASTGADEWRGGDGPLSVLCLGGVADQNPLAQAIAQAGVSAGHLLNDDWNGARCDGTIWSQLTIRDGRRDTAATAFVDPVRDRQNLCVASGVFVRRLAFANGRCTGIDVAMAGGAAHIGRVSEVILSAGAIDTPRLLMLSGVGDAAMLGAADIAVELDRPQVGRNLQDHLLVPGLLLQANRPVPPSRFNHCETMIVARSSFADSVPDIQIMGLAAPVLSPELGVAPTDAFSFVPALMAPKSLGSLVLQGNGEHAVLQIDPGYLTAPHDVEVLVDAFEMSREILAQPAMREWVMAELHPGPQMRDRKALGEHIHRAASPFFHPVSTCRMGAEDAAVVDPQCRVRGVAGLRIVDASIMPSIPQAMTNAAVLALAERASDVIRSTAA